MHSQLENSIREKDDDKAFEFDGMAMITTIVFMTIMAMMTLTMLKAKQKYPFQERPSAALLRYQRPNGAIASRNVTTVQT